MATKYRKSVKSKGGTVQIVIVENVDSLLPDHMLREKFPHCWVRFTEMLII